MTGRIERAVARRVTKLIATLADRARDNLPRDVRVEVGDDRVTLIGRRLRARSLSDARLRSIR